MEYAVEGDMKTSRKVYSHEIVDIFDDSSANKVRILSQKQFRDIKKRHIQPKVDDSKPHHMPNPKEFDRLVQEKIKINKRGKKSDSGPVPKEIDIDNSTDKNSRKKLHFQNKGIYDIDENEFYKTFFRDRERIFDGHDKRLNKITNQVLKVRSESLKEGGRVRISPLKYWIKPNYVSPSVNEVAGLTSADLKFVMMNETRNPSKDDVLWDTFLERVIAVSEKVNLRNLLRYLQIFSIVQITPNKNLKKLVDIINSRRSEMKPKYYVFLFQALARLRFRDQRLNDNLYEMILCWSVLRNNFLIKASNSIAKLGMNDSILIKPLQCVLEKRISTFNGSECARIKAITIIDIFTEEMTLEFLKRCEYYKNYFRGYTRHLRVVELYLRLLRNKVYEQLDQQTREFLIELRRADQLKNNDNDCDREKYSCHEHKDVSRVLTLMGINHRNSVPAGQLILDIYEPTTKAVIEINSMYQYYAYTSNLTTLAKRWWIQLETDQNKIEALKKLIATY
ncbi:hypothetical protein BEWA_008220 [Theileria equi strain WA]|uniref:RAP domain-containing protein n=1 Tax=Theileria equi strain WA TaxID=1537102 RepID=L0B0P9_THEEQ|nr:hypothetical protein BEWA_008220 [Theileria equi strain WA]AFZ81412.1 hypothetical protein BEWA_008220 [Theileria equi strain WA]|eukprot:XP_004831078.1 hypothetical protein BEWA_008220 [Theileria equi strain WA]